MVHKMGFVWVSYIKLPAARPLSILMTSSLFLLSHSFYMNIFVISLCFEIIICITLLVMFNLDVLFPYFILTSLTCHLLHNKDSEAHGSSSGHFILCCC